MDDSALLSQRIRDTRGLSRHLVRSLRSYFRKNGKKRAVVGLSGGIDSAVVAALAVRALGKNNVHAFHFPYWKNASDETHARMVARSLGVKLTVVPINSIADSFASAVKTKQPLSRGNFMSRSRMALLYHFARVEEGLVLGTGNKPEFLMGYFTKFGDGAADYFPLADVYKAQVRALALELDLPTPIIEKPPSAGLWPGQTDEKELGITYDQMDSILCALTELHWTRSRVEKIFGKKPVDQVVSRMIFYAHKRLPAGQPDPI